jgi:hypothetical protein
MHNGISSESTPDVGYSRKQSKEKEGKEKAKEH